MHLSIVMFIVTMMRGQIKGDATAMPSRRGVACETLSGSCTSLVTCHALSPGGARGVGTNHHMELGEPRAYIR